MASSSTINDADQTTELRRPTCANHARSGNQARRFQRYHCANPAFTRGQQFLEPRSRRPTTGPTEIVIDELNVVPAELSRALKAVLAALALEFVDHLVSRRLTYIYKRRGRDAPEVDLLISIGASCFLEVDGSRGVITASVNGNTRRAGPHTVLRSTPVSSAARSRV